MQISLFIICVIADVILEPMNLIQEQRDELGKNGRKYTLKIHDYEKLAKELN
jgi:hypothetical protein